MTKKNSEAQNSFMDTSNLQSDEERLYTEEDAQLWADSWILGAREDFWTFRKVVRPGMLESWWQKNVADRLMQFYLDFIAGKRPKMLLMAPPQHGKSEQVRDFIAWIVGRNPELRVIFSSYSDELGVFTNLALQRMLLSPLYNQIFPYTNITRVGERDLSRARRTSNILEFLEQNGSFRNTTVEGAITGFGLDIGIIDDPIKGRAEAQSKTIRDKAWNWLTDDFFLRFSNSAGMIMILTRWHVDDPAGRFIEKFRNTEIVKYAAIAESANDWTVKAGHRQIGDPLMPDHKSMDFLQERRRALTHASWEALYQQNPIIVGGGIFPIEKLLVLPAFGHENISKSVRYVDKAGCLLAGTMITTLRGQVPIEDVLAGELVLTQSGFQRVERSWMSGRVNELTTVIFSDGSQLTGTPDHPVYVEGGYWIGLGTLVSSDRVLHRSELTWPTTETRTLKKYFSGDDATCETPEENPGAGSDISTVMHGTRSLRSTFRTRCIEKSGRPNMGIYPVAMISTISTVTGITITSKILGSLQDQSITAFMAGKSLSEKLCGIGISRMVQNCEQRHKQLFAPSATFALAVDSHLPHEVSSQNIVSDASVSAFGGVPVFDLTVENAHAFFANDLLVHNTQDGGAYTAMVLMHKLRDGRIVIEHVARGQWSALEREQHLLSMAKRDTALLKSPYEIVVEQEPGSGGKESAEATIRNLVGYRVFADKVTGSKEVRAEPFAAQVQGGNVFLVAGNWVMPFLEELESYPNGKYMDQADAAAGAFNRLVSKPAYNLDILAS